MSNSSMLWIVVALIVFGGGAYWWMSARDASPNAAVDQGASSIAPGAESGTTLGMPVPGNEGVEEMVVNAAMTGTVTYDGSSFSPQSITIKKGGTVTWTNSSTGKMWVASAQHPTHTVYDNTTRTEHCASGYTGAKPFDQCVGGMNFSFTFDKVGTFNYHDHINASAFGSVTVVE